MKSLRSTGSATVCAHGLQDLQASLKELAIGQHAEAGRAVPLVDSRDFQRVGNPLG